MDYSLDSLLKNDGFECPSCGRRHFGLLKDCIIKDGAMGCIPELVKKYGASYPFVLCDENTYKAAGETVCGILDGNGIKYFLHIIGRDKPSPDEKTIGEAIMYCPTACDCVIGIGGGVINDTSKVVASQKKVPEIIVATAPSMDGFASATSSVERSGLKISLNSKCPEAVVADSEIIVRAPKRMILSGIGDMLAKYVSIVEWKIANILVGDYYCETIAEIVRSSLAQCIAGSKGALNGDRKAVCSVIEGLVVSGLAMNYAGISRPASGMEHYISHITDMRALEFGTPDDFHGIQCGIATLTVIKAYEELVKRIPNRDKALASVASFDLEKWNNHLKERLGHGADAIIAGEEKERKYDKEKHAHRLKIIIENWDTITEIISELPKSSDIEKFMLDIGHPTKPEEIGLTADDWHEAFGMAKDIRDKYILGRLLWDLGETGIG